MIQSVSLFSTIVNNFPHSTTNCKQPLSIPAKTEIFRIMIEYTKILLYYPQFCEIPVSYAFFNSVTVKSFTKDKF